MSQAFQTSFIDAGGTMIRIRRGGEGPPLLLLHGFPETLEMWGAVADRLARRFEVVCADLRGYGQSGCPPSDDRHEPYSKRAMASDAVATMASLGHERFGLIGHDRGGRVSYRTALDYPLHIERLAVLDVLPIDTVWDRADARLALGFWPWSLLAQARPLPERLIGAAPEAVIGDALGPGWGTPADAFDDQARAEYLAQLADPDHLHAICEEYRAGAGIDREHDRADRETGRRIECPTLALWSAEGPLGSWYQDAGGPLELWRALAPQVEGRGVAGGHFFPEQHPADTAAALAGFFAV